MANFTLWEMPEVKGIIGFRKLVIDGFCPYDEFCKLIEGEGNLRKQLIGIAHTMNEVANRRSLPKEKFRDITPEKDLVREYEFKKGDLRVYAIKDVAGHIVILGGKKNSQKKDIRSFRAIKQRYLQSKKEAS